MNSDTTTVRRPVALWVIVILYSTLIALHVVTHSYLRFWSEHRSAYEDWTALDYVWQFYPALMILVGCVGLVMLKRWAMYVFGVLATVRLWETTRWFDEREIEELTSMFVWLPQLFAVAPPAIAFLYALHLSNKGVLR